jgi:NitT/TauT family transport system substrate-binding protein
MQYQRRSLLLTSLMAALPLGAARAATPPIRVGTLRFGSVAWELNVMHSHGLDKAAGVVVEPVEFAAAQAAQVALQAGRVDMVLQDWLWVSRQRASGADWTLSPTSSALGAVMAPAASPVQTVADLRGRRLGIAGSPLDKSWLLLRAYAQQTLGLDLDQATTKSFGPPPLLAEQMTAGRLDAVLTYWPFAARAEAAGLRRVLAMEDAVEAMGVPLSVSFLGVPFLGWVFSDAFAARNTAAVQGFIQASARARSILVESDAEWDRIAPLTGTSGPGELARLREWYRRGVPDQWNLDATARLYDVLAAIGGPELVGPATHLAPGTFWSPG